MRLANIRQQALLHRALEALEATTGIHGRSPGNSKGYLDDAMIEIHANGQCYPYVAEIRCIDRFAILGEIKQHYAQQPPLLVAPHISTETAEKCRQLDLQFIDASGNTYLHGPGLYVFVKGQRPTEKRGFLMTGQEGKRAGTAAHLRVIFALLYMPELLNAPYRKIAQAAGVALGTIGQVFDDLANRGILTGGKRRGGRVMLARSKLCDEWTTNYPITLRPKLNPRRFKAPTPDWWKTIDLTRYNAQWGAEVAVEKLTGHLRPSTATLYLHTEQGQQALTQLVAENRLRPDREGNIEVLDAFWTVQGVASNAQTAPPLLVYADLLATLDPRNLEAAKLIHDRYLEPAESTT